MEVIRVMRKGGFSLGILIMVMLMLLATSQPGANGGFLKELSGDTIIADNMELEFLMDSEVSRKLVDSPHVTDGTDIAGMKVITDCGKGISYTPCLPAGRNSPKKGETCDLYHHKRGGC